ncbi:MAG: hypothetical protein AB1644_10710 [Candidatus Zixiibacteriota bacterium]
MVRSILAVAAGYLVMAVLTLIFFAALGILVPEHFGVGMDKGNLFPLQPWPLVILGTGLVFAAAGGNVTVLIARQTPGQHIYWLAAVIVVMGLVSAFAARGVQPLWYQVALVIVGIIGVMIGGALRRTPQS